MKIDRFFQLFVVKEKKFYPLYIALSENIKEGAGLLLELVREADPDKRASLARAIKDCERHGDRITDKILEELYRTFVTPFDREDIHTLASRMDTFLDFINDSAKKMSIYHPKRVDAPVIRIAELIYKDAELLEQLIGELEDLRKKGDHLDSLCTRINDIEHEADDIYEEYMSFLFTEEKDAIELTKNKNIIQAFEDTTDRAKAVAEVVRTIIVKQA